jgi:hypothetical protein
LVAKELWEAGERILAAFAALLGVQVRTLPSVAGLIALGGVWVLKNVDLSSLGLPSFLQTSSEEGPTDRVTIDHCALDEVVVVGEEEHRNDVDA